jgi:hypothetical protein
MFKPAYEGTLLLQSDANDHQRDKQTMGRQKTAHAASDDTPYFERRALRRKLKE